MDVQFALGNMGDVADEHFLAPGTTTTIEHTESTLYSEDGVTGVCLPRTKKPGTASGGLEE